MEHAASPSHLSALSSKHDQSTIPSSSDPEKNLGSDGIPKGLLPPNEEKKEVVSVKDNDGSPLSQQGSAQLSHQLSRIATTDYPTGLRLGMIVLALVLSIFLVSLDMVSHFVTICSINATKFILTLQKVDRVDGHTPYYD